MLTSCCRSCYQRRIRLPSRASAWCQNCLCAITRSSWFDKSSIGGTKSRDGKCRHFSRQSHGGQPRLVSTTLLHVAIKSANSTFSLIRLWGVACSLFDTWPRMLRGVLSKLLTFRISITSLALKKLRMRTV